MLVLVQTSVFGQLTNEEFHIVHITINVDSLFFAESYEINLSKKKVYLLNPNISYLRVKGGKRILNTVSINNSEWNSISELLFLTLNKQHGSYQFDSNSNYILSTFDGMNQVQKYSFQKSNVPAELVEILKIIRNQPNKTE